MRIVVRRYKYLRKLDALSKKEERGKRRKNVCARANVTSAETSKYHLQLVREKKRRTEEAFATFGRREERSGGRNNFQDAPPTTSSFHAKFFSITPGTLPLIIFHCAKARDKSDVRKVDQRNPRGRGARREIFHSIFENGTNDGRAGI